MMSKPLSFLLFFVILSALTRCSGTSFFGGSDSTQNSTNKNPPPSPTPATQNVVPIYSTQPAPLVYATPIPTLGPLSNEMIANAPSTPPTPAPALTVDEAFRTGAHTEHVGVNFDDNRGSVDFNDTAFCFNGSFAVKNTSIVSLRTQTVTINMTNRSTCSMSFEIYVKDRQLGVKSKTDKMSHSHNTETFSLPFSDYDSLDIKLIQRSCDKIYPETADLSNAAFFRVEQSCNNSGI